MGYVRYTPGGRLGMAGTMGPDAATSTGVTPELTSIPPADIPGSGMEVYMWIPYVILGGVLILLAVGSFVHYHVQNRGRYEEQKDKAKAGSENGVGNRKYRVTLNINGAPYTIGKSALEELCLKDRGDTCARNVDIKHNSVLPPIKARVRAVKPADRADEMPDGQRTGSSSPEAKCSYINEAFDSSGDSEKSLISREMLKKQRRAEKYRQSQSSSVMETLSSDLDPDEQPPEMVEKVKDVSKARRKPSKQKYSSGNGRKGISPVVPALPDRSSHQYPGDDIHRYKIDRTRKASEGERSSRVHPEIDSSRDSLHSEDDN